MLGEGDRGPPWGVRLGQWGRVREWGRGVEATSLCSGESILLKRSGEGPVIILDRGVFSCTSISLSVRFGSPRGLVRKLFAGLPCMTKNKEKAKIECQALRGGRCFTPPFLTYLSEVAQQTTRPRHARDRHHTTARRSRRSRTSSQPRRRHQQRMVARLQGWRAGQLATAISASGGGPSAGFIVVSNPCFRKLLLCRLRAFVGRCGWGMGGAGLQQH